MKKSDKIKLSIAFILIITIVFAMINRASAQEKYQTCINIEFSDAKYATIFKVVVNGKSYFTNAIILKGDEYIRLVEFKRNGDIKGTHCFLLNQCKIYQSK